MLDLVILSLGFLVHMWVFPYPFKNLLFDGLVRFVQLAFGSVIVAILDKGYLMPNPMALAAGLGVGAACFLFQLFYHRGIRLRRADLSASYIGSQAMILLFHIPAEEVLYRGLFFLVLSNLWGSFTAIFLTTALSGMIMVASSRRPIDWIGAGLMGALCGMGCYYTQSLWAPLLIHVANDLGGSALQGGKDLFRRREGAPSG